jgi:(p)ppGpp synthase/HD superfamily hydrolase
VIDTEERSPTVRLGRRFADAVAYAAELHARQSRKGSGGVPYVSHLLAVAGLVLEDGGDEDEAIAALLHDGPEDQGGEATLAAIRRRFGDTVADIVEACSDTFETPKPPWRARKERYVAHLKKASPALRRVAAADKLHNLVSLLAEVRAEGAGAFDRFKTSTPSDQVWYYKACGAALVTDADSALARRVVDAAQELENAVRDLDAREGLLPKPSSEA